MMAVEEDGPATADKLEEAERLKQRIRDAWNEGPQEIEKIAKHLNLTVREVREELVRSKLIPWEAEDHALTVSELGAEYVGKTYIFSIDTLSLEGPKTLPTSVRCKCKRCGTESTISIDPIQYAMASPEVRQKFKTPMECPEDQGGCKRTSNQTGFEIEENGLIDYHILEVADIIDETKFIEGYTDTRRTVHLIHKRPTIQGRLRLRAKVISDSRSLDIALVADDFREIEDRVTAPKMDSDLKKRFTDIGRLPMEIFRKQISPDMVGREIVQEGRLITLASALNLPDVESSKVIRGAISEVLGGDTKTNKSECARDTATTKGFGPFIDAENAGRTGLTHGITESKTGGWRISWGELVLNHGRYVVIDGLESWSPELLGKFRAVLNDGRVKVDKVVKGIRPARLRYTCTCNPEKPMDEYAFPVMAIPKIKPFANKPDITRFDLWFLFSQADVSGETIANREGIDRPIDDHTFRLFISWCWSRKATDYEYTQEARKTIKEEAAKFMSEYGCPSIPLVHPGFRDVLCRVSASFANLRFSTTNGSNVIIDTAHVELACDFLRRMYDLLQLKEYKSHVEDGVVLDGGVFMRTYREIGEEGLRVLNGISQSQSGHATASELSERLGEDYTVDAIRHRYDDLKSCKLIETKPNRGAELTSTGARFLKMLATVDKLFSHDSARTPDETPKDAEANLANSGENTAKPGGSSHQESIILAEKGENGRILAKKGEYNSSVGGTPP